MASDLTAQYALADSTLGAPDGAAMSLNDALAPDAAPQNYRLPFVSVAIGASAGGVEALVRLFKAMPADTGCAFLIVMHLTPDRRSDLAPLLGRATSMPVQEAADGMRPQPNHVYIIAPGHYLEMRQGLLRTVPIMTRPPMPKAIDQLMISLAQDQRENTIGIVLTGGDGDGSLGLKAIKSEGGMTIAQAPLTSAYPSMPTSAIATGHVDQQLSIEDMPRALADLVRNAGLVVVDEPLALPGDAQLAEILQRMRTRLQLDFAGYKTPMLARRIRRRFALSHVADMAAYLRLLHDSPAELEALANDFLINVTAFFREPPAWQALADDILPALMKGPARDGEGHDSGAAFEVRAWVPACSTGEEAYSLAMLMLEAAEDGKRAANIQIFASDVDRRALRVARRGLYPQSIGHSFAPARLRRFFREVDGGLQVTKQLRQCVTFAEQNVVCDPPFSRMDIISCRNLLIYMQPALQHRVLQAFHFGLRDGGILVLGKAENATGQETLFEPISALAKIYRRLPGARSAALRFEFRAVAPGDADTLPHPPAPASDIVAAVQRALQGRDADAAAVVTDRDGAVLYFHGPVDRYFQQRSGAATHRLMDMLGDDVREQVHAAMREAADNGRSYKVIGAARGDKQVLRVVVAPLPGVHSDRATREPLLLVSFETRADDSEAEPAPSAEADAAARNSLEGELQRTRSDLRSANEDLETTNEELKVAHEEAMSTNEELQSTNEELATSKEELESVNEELVAVNQQLEFKIDELETVNDDLSNLLASTSIPTLFLDAKLHIKRFTPAATRLFKLIATDLNRPITDIASRVDMGVLVHDAQQVLQHLSATETEVESSDAEYYLQHAAPYRARDDRIGGVVITFTDITRLKAAAVATRRFAALMKASHDAIVVHEPGGRIVAWNRGAEQMYGLSEADALGRDIGSLLSEPVREIYAAEIAHVRAGGVPRVVEVRRSGPQGQSIDVSAGVSLIDDGRGGEAVAAWIERDVSERAAAEQARRESEMRFRSLADNAPVLIWMADLQGMLQFVNRAFSTFVGQSARRLNGRLLSDFLSREEGEAFMRAIAALQRGHARHQANLRLHSRFGEPRWMKCTVMWRPAASGVAEGLIGTMTDIQQQIDTQASQQQAAQRKDEFLAMLGHELRNPLAPIRTAAAVLQRVGGDDPQLAWVRGVLVRQVVHMTRLVDDLLDISLVTKGALRLRLEPVDLVFTLRRAAESVQPLVERKHHRLSLTLPDEPVWIEGDAVRMVQIFDNLLTNAAKYTDDDGQLSVSLELHGDDAVVRIADNGLGLSASMLPRIFELFVQDERSVDRSQGGLGIGLALVKRLVDLHGATIAASSEGPGKGSCFELHFRRITAAAPAAAEITPRPANGAGKVLIVDDDPDVGESLAMLLRMDGYDVEHAADLDAALRSAQSLQPRVVLMDLAMPVHDGYAVAQRLRALPCMDGARYIAVSGFAGTGDRQRSEQAGFAHHLVKPVNPDELEALLDDALGANGDGDGGATSAGD